MTQQKFLFLALLLIFQGCSHTPTRPFRPEPAPVAKELPKAQGAKCDRFCEEIASCAHDEIKPEQKELLCRIARCETGDKCISEIRSPSGAYHGPFQFSKGSWKALCYPLFESRGLERCKVPEARNDLCCSSLCASEVIFVKNGIKHWPTCGKRAQKTLRMTNQ